jgi:GNAT superfamily N-acetyltransferase
MTTTSTLSPGFTVRQATQDDFEAVFRVEEEATLADYGEAASREELTQEWQAKGPGRLVVLAPTGAVIATGRAEASPSGKYLLPLVKVLPDYQGRGIGTALLHLLEAQARQRSSATSPALFLARVSGRNSAAQKILAQSGYRLGSIFQIMELTMREPPPMPADSAGIDVRLFRVRQDEQAVYEADEEAFLDERGKTPRSFSVWSHRLGMDTAQFDPTLWYVAWDGEQIAGTSVSEIAQGRAEMHHLGVRRPWRRRGLGMALLLRTLGACYQRGVTTVRLNVDGQSLTNAHLLYTRAGFQVVNAYWHYEKSVQPTGAS